MIQRKNPALSRADTGSISAAISTNPALLQAKGGKVESQSAMPHRENRLICAACRHAIVRSTPQAMQP